MTVTTVLSGLWSFTPIRYLLELAAVVLGLRLAVGLWRVWPRSRAAWRFLVPALWHCWRWRWLSRNLNLSYLDEHRRRSRRPAVPFGTSVRVVAPGAGQPAKLRFPRARFRPADFGLVADVRTIPGVGLAEVERSAVWIQDSWRCCRVAVSQPRPGRVRVTGFRRDPLLEPLRASVLSKFDGRHVTLGRDEHGSIRRASLANHAGSCWAGNPGRGKTEAALSLAVQLAGSPLVDMWVLDGGACDWAHFATGAAGYVADDLGAAADMLSGLNDKMRNRRRTLEADLGVRNAWRIGPTPDYRLQWLLVEECPFYLSLDAVKGDRKREALVAECRGLLAGLLMRGRAPMFHTSLLAQKPTTTSLPSQIRDLCGLRWCFGVSTTDTAVAALGDDIRRHETLSPVQLQGDDYIGIASVLLPTNKLPYTLLRFPEVGEELADKTALAFPGRRGPVCVACVGDGGDCLRCKGSGVDPDITAPVLTAV
jgi:DNA segregation ATPase FtsK/SpoIIIE, S-DNA-T family